MPGSIGAPPVNPVYSPHRQMRGGLRQKSSLSRDSLIPAMGDFGYAGAQASIHVLLETTP
jgi:hypothetical protein